MSDDDSATFDVADDGSVSLPPDDLFRAVIQRADGVCNNCFRQTHDVDRVAVWKRSHMSAGVGDQRARRPGATTREGAPGGPPTHGERTVCLCGEFDSEADRPIDLPTAIRYGAHIVRRLQDAGIAVDPPTFLTTLKERKNRPETQNAADSRVFAPATREAYLAALPDQPTYDPADQVDPDQRPRRRPYRWDDTGNTPARPAPTAPTTGTTARITVAPIAGHRTRRRTADGGPLRSGPAPARDRRT